MPPGTFRLFLFAIVETVGSAWFCSYLFLPDRSLPQLGLRLGIGAALALQTIFLARKHSQGTFLMGGIVGFILYALSVIVAFVPRR